MGQLEDQEERLRRHYEHAIRTYDRVSLQDLSNSLRMWLQMVPGLMKSSSIYASRQFYSGSPHNRMKVLARKCEKYLIATLAPHTTTYAHGGKLVQGLRTTENMTLGTIFSPLRIRKNKPLDILASYYLSKEIDDSDNDYMKHPTIKMLNMTDWMGAEVVRYKFTNEKGEVIKASMSRAICINRVANTMDGCHPSSYVGYDKGSNIWNEHLDFVNLYQSAGTHLPYLILMNTAQQILDIPSAVNPNRKIGV